MGALGAKRWCTRRQRTMQRKGTGHGGPEMARGQSFIERARRIECSGRTTRLHHSEPRAPSRCAPRAGASAETAKATLEISACRSASSAAITWR